MDFFLGAQDPAIKHAAQVRAVSKILGVSPQSVLQAALDADPTERKIYVGWILKQMRYRNIRLPEDSARVSQILRDLEEIKIYRPGAIAIDINRYPQIHELERLIDELPAEGSERSKERPRIIESLPSDVFVHSKSDDYMILQVTDPEACVFLGRGTKWCTKDSRVSESYLERYGRLYVILKNEGGQWVVHGQYTPDYSQIMDTRDAEFVPDHELATLMFPNLNMPDAAENAVVYAASVLRDRWPEGEDIVRRDSEWAYMYARDVVEGPWPPGESAIARDAESALSYAISMLGGQFQEGEAAIAKDPMRSYRYAVDVLHDRFPQGEKAIASEAPSAFYYARDIIKGRWQPGEREIYNHPGWMLDYEKLLREKS